MIFILIINKKVLVLFGYLGQIFGWIIPFGYVQIFTYIKYK